MSHRASTRQFTAPAMIASSTSIGRYRTTRHGTLLHRKVAFIDPSPRAAASISSCPNATASASTLYRRLPTHDRSPGRGT